MGKGENFEREISRFLSLWLTDGKRDDIIWRKRVRRTNKTPNAEFQLGDIKAEDAIAIPFTDLFSVELKTGYSRSKNKKGIRNTPWDLLDVIDHTSTLSRKKEYNPTIIEFWEQTFRDSCISEKKPLLIFKRDYHIPVVCTSKEVYLSLIFYCGDYVFDYSTLHFKSYVLYFFTMIDFFEWLTPDIIAIINRSNNLIHQN